LIPRLLALPVAAVLKQLALHFLEADRLRRVVQLEPADDQGDLLRVQVVASAFFFFPGTARRG
jgi:hypothetical protein